MSLSDVSSRSRSWVGGAAGQLAGRALGWRPPRRRVEPRPVEAGRRLTVWPVSPRWTPGLARSGRSVT